MKTLFKYLSTIALALVLFVPTQTKAQTADNYVFPPGVSFQHVVGKELSPQEDTGNSTTMDAIDFGFWSRYVKICMRSGSFLSYFRMGTTFAASATIQAADLTKMTIPAGTSAIFIDGDAASFDFGAMPMTTASGDALADVEQAHCTTQPWRTRGVIMHITSGVATADVWGYR